jgi:hypothetical protein
MDFLTSENGNTLPVMSTKLTEAMAAVELPSVLADLRVWGRVARWFIFKPNPKFRKILKAL